MLSDDHAKKPSSKQTKQSLNIINTIFKSNLNPDNIASFPPLDDMISATATDFMQAIYEGYGMTIEVAWDKPDLAKLLHIEKNVYQFSGAKNYQMLRDLTDAMRSPSGAGVLTKAEFRKKAFEVIGEYNGPWRDTEYNTCIAGAQAGSRWQQFIKNPNAILEFRTSGSERVCPICSGMNGMRRPVNDPYWDIHAAPLHYNCSCHEIELNTGRPTPEKELAHPDIPTMFRTNVGKHGIIFPKNHPYFIGCPKEVLEQVLTLIPDHKPK